MRNTNNSLLYRDDIVGKPHSFFLNIYFRNYNFVLIPTGRKHLNKKWSAESLNSGQKT